jgi:hypothetical protein
MIISALALLDITGSNNLACSALPDAPVVRVRSKRR